MLSPYKDHPVLAQRIMQRTNDGKGKTGSSLGNTHQTSQKFHDTLYQPSQNYFPSHMS